MEFGRHPTQSGPISVADWIAEFGHRSIDGRIEHIDRARCPACDAKLKVRSEGSLLRTQHFSHLGAAPACPLVSIHGTPFLALPHRRSSLETATALKRSFRTNWKKHYGRLSREYGGIIPYLNASEFITLLEVANERNIWGLVDIHECHIPYLMLSFRDFSPQFSPISNTTERRNWFRYVYTDVRSAEDIWIRHPEETNLTSLAFRMPQASRRRPRQKDFCGFRDIPIEVDFLARPEPALRSSVVHQIEQWFARHPSFG